MPKNRHPMFALYGYVLYWALTAGAPIPVFGWILDMLDIQHPIRNRIWLSIGIGVSVGMLCMYKWAVDGCRGGRHEERLRGRQLIRSGFAAFLIPLCIYDAFQYKFIENQ